MRFIEKFILLLGVDIMKHWIKKSIIILVICCILYVCGIWVVGYLIDNGYTNSLSQTIQINTGMVVQIPAENQQVQNYLALHPEDKQAVYEAYGYLNGTGNAGSGWFPPDVLNDVGFSFIMKGISTRKLFLDTVKSTSEKLGIDDTLVLSSLL